MTLPGPDAADAERRERIRLSHYRSERAGLRPDTALEVATEDFDTDSRLLNACRPALLRLSESLNGLMAGGLMTDRRGTVVERYFGHSQMAQAADRLGAVVGASFNEERTGTNALSLPLETRERMLVRADEHFLEDLQGFTCYGVPVINPITNRLEGVIDLMVAESISPELMATVLDQAVDDITGRLLGDYDPGIAQQIAAFKSLSNRTRDAVTLIARDFIVHNLRAADLVSGTDADSLRQLAESLGPGGHDRMLLSSGVDVTVDSSPAGTGAVLLRLRDRGAEQTRRRTSSSSSRVSPGDRLIASARDSKDSVLVVGEPGSGRSRTAAAVAPSENVVALDATKVNEDQIRSAVAQLRQEDDRTLVLEHVDQLDSDSARTVVGLMLESPPLRVIATTGPGFADNPEIEYFSSLCCSWIEVPPLRQRAPEFRSIVESIVKDIATARSLPAQGRPVVSRSAMHHLKALPWPGNIAELRRVLEAAIDRRSAGDITVSDLPERYQRASSTRTNLTPIEQSERDVIVNALAQFSGNKLKTAQHLGISRSKLYDRLRHFRIEIP